MLINKSNVNLRHAARLCEFEETRAQREAVIDLNLFWAVSRDIQRANLIKEVRMTYKVFVTSIHVFFMVFYASYREGRR